MTWWKSGMGERKPAVVSGNLLSVRWRDLRLLPPRCYLSPERASSRHYYMSGLRTPSPCVATRQWAHYLDLRLQPVRRGIDVTTNICQTMASIAANILWLRLLADTTKQWDQFKSSHRQSSNRRHTQKKAPPPHSSKQQTPGFGFPVI